MPDGIHHHKVWRQNWIWVLPLSFISYGIVDPLGLSWTCGSLGCLSGNILVSVGVPLGYAMGRYIDPDLDEMSTTAAEGRMVNEIPVLGHFLYGHWSTYGSIFRRHHRSFWTHFPGVSTAIRIFYQFWFLFWLIFDKHWYYPWIFHIFLGIFAGLSFSDFLHWLEDIKSKEIRMSFVKRKKVT